jgi:hypothetical protein
MLIRPIWPVSYSLNQSSPSRTTSESGRQPGVRPSENSVTVPLGVMRPDVTDVGFGEPHISVRTRDDAVRAGAGPLWFCENASNKIGRITTSGAVAEFPVPTPHWPRT